MLPSAPTNPAPLAQPFNWGMISALVACACLAATAVASAASTERRVVALEQQNPPGMLQRIDERTLQMQESLRRLEASR